MDLHWYKTLDSTNDEARTLARQGAPHGTLVGADFQEKGRGRTGKSWQCAPGDGLMCSLILRPQWNLEDWGWIALTAGLALAELLERDCLSPSIKWPNDVLVNGKKIAGVLTEADGKVIIVGIGMNLNMPHLPPVDSSIPPTSFFLETDCRLDAASYARSVQAHLVSLTAASSPLLLKSQIEKRLAWRDRKVSLRVAEEQLTGQLLGLNRRGQLLIKKENKTISEVYDAHELRPVS